MSIAIHFCVWKHQMTLWFWSSTSNETCQTYTLIVIFSIASYPPYYSTLKPRLNSPIFMQNHSLPIPYHNLILALPKAIQPICKMTIMYIIHAYTHIPHGTLHAHHHSCQWGALNGGCVVVGKPHPSHLFTTPRHIAYETTWITQKNPFDGWNLNGWKNNVCKMKGLTLFIPLHESICVGFWRLPEGSLSSLISQWSSPQKLMGTFKSHTNALIQPVQFHFISSLVINRGLELMASTLGSTFWKEEVGVWFPLMTSPPPQVICYERLSLKNCMQYLWGDGGGYFIQREVFKLYLRGIEAKNWCIIGAFRYVKSQSTAEIFLAHDYMDDVHSASVTRHHHPCINGQRN